ncbi:hypothetical protein [uncultured Sulfitobacter sp.]|uniref:hypothetical protein n=1 Tax=uncultured Sulfitobacter sp. TaxID=191468 RepID=UPI002639E4FE|nr:hypothetical protein [uncultured Sulfitobacter sp.]
MKITQKLVGLLTAFMPVTANAGPSTADFMLSRAPSGSTLSQTFDWTPDGTEIQIVDPVVFPESFDSEWVKIPNRPAQVQMLISGPPNQAPLAAFVTFSRNTPVCHRSGGLFGVDGGMGAFTTSKTQESIKAYLATLPEGWSLYDGLLADQSDDGRNDLTLFKLPDGVVFPGFFTGGDGGFSVSALFDGAGDMVSLTVDFSRTATSPLIPPACEG